MKKIIFFLLLSLIFVQPTFAQTPEDGLEDGTMKVIGNELCQKPKANGGWGGTCKTNSILEDIAGTFTDVDPCIDSGENEEILAGLCNPTDDGATAQFCCVSKKVGIIENPSKEQLRGQIVTTNYCESQMKGKCENIDTPNFGSTASTLFGIDTKDATCDDPANEVVVSLCVDNAFFSSDANDQQNGCCVPKDGEYCKKLEGESGYNVCSTGAAGGTTTPLEYGDYELLEQIPGSDNTSGKLQPYLESLYKAGFVLIVIGAIFMIGFGGFTYMASAGNTAMLKKGKSMIMDAIIGLVIALLIWLILNIINPDLVNLKIDPLPGVSFDPAGTGADIAQQNSNNSGGGATGSFAAKLYSGGSLFTDSQAREYFSQNSVGVNKGDCSSPTDTNCTSLGDFPGSLAGVAVSIKNNCNCEVTVTGGTEAGHSTHGKGRAAMDMRKTSALDAFFSRQPKVGSSGGNPIYQYGRVKVWFEDSSHYHIWEPAN